MDTPRIHRTIKHSPGWLRAKAVRAAKRAANPEVRKRAALHADADRARRAAEAAK